MKLSTHVRVEWLNTVCEANPSYRKGIGKNENEVFTSDTSGAYAFEWLRQERRNSRNASCY